jgi:hypothetical protein
MRRVEPEEYDDLSLARLGMNGPDDDALATGGTPRMTSVTSTRALDDVVPRPGSVSAARVLVLIQVGLMSSVLVYLAVILHRGEVAVRRNPDLDEHGIATIALLLLRFAIASGIVPTALLLVLAIRFSRRSRWHRVATIALERISVLWNLFFGVFLGLGTPLPLITRAAVLIALTSLALKVNALMADEPVARYFSGERSSGLRFRGPSRS